MPHNMAKGAKTQANDIDTQTFHPEDHSIVIKIVFTVDLEAHPDFATPEATLGDQKGKTEHPCVEELC